MSSSRATPSSLGRRLALGSALLGWLFDGAEMGMFSLVGRPALRDLFSDPPESQVAFWYGLITAGFLVGAATGGVLFGWLGDRFGRVRAMTFSVMTYAIFTGACGAARSPAELACLRFVASLGMGGEWSLGVALVMELWPNRSRAFLAGLIGAAGNIGYLLVAILGLGLVSAVNQVTELLLAMGVAVETTERLTSRQGWRLLMFCGAAPAALTLIIRLCVPESEGWLAGRERGAVAHWRLRNLGGVALGSLGAIGVLWLWSAAAWPLGAKLAGTLAGLFVALWGYLYPVTCYIRRANEREGAARLDLGAARRRLFLAAALSGVPLLGTWASVQWAPTWADKLAASQYPQAASYTLIAQASGATLGAFLAALAGDWLGRRNAYRLLCVASYGSILWLFQGHTEFGPGLLAAATLAGFCTASFYGWLPLYLPELFPTSIRATGQGFGYNFGRILAAIGVLQTGELTQLIDGNYPRACSAISAVYLVGLVVIAFGPERAAASCPLDSGLRRRCLRSHRAGCMTRKFPESRHFVANVTGLRKCFIRKRLRCPATISAACDSAMLI